MRVYNVRTWALAIGLTAIVLVHPSLFCLGVVRRNETPPALKSMASQADFFWHFVGMDSSSLKRELSRHPKDFQWQLWSDYAVGTSVGIDTGEQIEMLISRDRVYAIKFNSWAPPSMTTKTTGWIKEDGHADTALHAPEVDSKLPTLCIANGHDMTKVMRERVSLQNEWNKIHPGTILDIRYFPDEHEGLPIVARSSGEPAIDKAALDFISRHLNDFRTLRRLKSGIDFHFGGR